MVWTRQGELISQGGEGRLRTNTLGRRRHSLVITRVQQSDFGQYTCSAVNNLGRANKTIQLSGRKKYKLGLGFLFRVLISLILFWKRI